MRSTAQEPFMTRDDAGANEQRDPQTYEIIGACMAVHRELGHGFLEPVYQAALEVEFKCRNIPHEREKHLPVFYRRVRLDTHYEADFVCYGDVIVELKALSALASDHDAQVINYLKATGIERGLLVNFGAAKLQFKRLILSREYLHAAQSGEWRSARTTESPD
jgi:GxxExxY protein